MGLGLHLNVKTGRAGVPTFCKAYHNLYEIVIYNAWIQILSCDVSGLLSIYVFPIYIFIFFF